MPFFLAGGGVGGRGRQGRDRSCEKKDDVQREEKGRERERETDRDEGRPFLLPCFLSLLSSTFESWCHAPTMDTPSLFVLRRVIPPFVRRYTVGTVQEWKKTGLHTVTSLNQLYINLKLMSPSPLPSAKFLLFCTIILFYWRKD